MKKLLMLAVVAAICAFVGCTGQAACESKCEDKFPGGDNDLEACQDKCKPDTELPSTGMSTGMGI